METMPLREKDHADVAVPPPLYLGVPLALGLLLQRAAPLPSAPRPLRLAVGIPLVLGGLLVGAWALHTLFRHNTSPSPREPTNALVSSGPYRFSRNPLYMSSTMIYLGVSSMAGSLWALLLLPLGLTLLYLQVIRREEAYLERKFGDVYLAYKRRVRRWV